MEQLVLGKSLSRPWWRYSTLKLAIVPASVGSKPAVVFGGREKTSTLDCSGMEWCALQLSATSANFQMPASSTPSHCGGTAPGFLQQRGFFDVPKTKAGHLLPSMFAHKNTVTLTLLCFPPLNGSVLSAWVFEGSN